jgi:two-component system KDP operon response regulator KdpE
VTSILVVDDDPRILRMVSSFLKADGYHVVTAEDGNSALDAIAESPPALVLLDLNLPDIDGDEVFRRARIAGYDGPIVLISADLRAQQIAASLGAAYLSKPFDPADLYMLIEELTARQEARAS